MKERRYKRSFRIVHQLDERTGRDTRSAEYTGDYYRFPAGSPAARQRALLRLPWALLYWAAALLYLKTGLTTSHCLYALLPLMLGLFPGLYGSMGLYALWTAPERMTVVHREKGPGRMTRSWVSCGALNAVSAIGCAVFLSLSGQWAAGWSDAALAALAAAAALAAFSGSRGDLNALEAIR